MLLQALDGMHGGEGGWEHPVRGNRRENFPHIVGRSVAALVQVGPGFGDGYQSQCSSGAQSQPKRTWLPGGSHQSVQLVNRRGV